LGKLIVIEGIDGSGKSTQFELMCRRLEAENKDFFRVIFPRYDKPSSALIKMYLGGDFGSEPSAVNAYAASSFYAVDRYASFKQDWQGYYENGGLVLTDRYTTSNAIHHGAKFSPESREHFFKWLFEYESYLLGLPKPDLVLYMSIDAEVAAERLLQREAKTGKPGDIHETNIAYLKSCVECANHAADYYGWKTIKCLSGGRARAESEIHQDAFDEVMKLF